MGKKNEKACVAIFWKEELNEFVHKLGSKMPIFSFSIFVNFGPFKPRQKFALQTLQLTLPHQQQINPLTPEGFQN